MTLDYQCLVVRIAELLCEFSNKHNKKDCLMPSDVKTDLDSVSFWLRSEKVSSDLGNVVEVWSVKDREDLDPVLALKFYLGMRNEKFGYDDELPVFVHEDGSNLSRSEFNKVLQQLLDTFPELSSSERDSWSGHSFRSGLTTMLQTLGFSEESIKNWGRWKSAAYLCYMKDMTARRKTQSRLTTTFSDILKLF